MQYRTIAGTDLRVSLLGFGNFVFGTNWWGDFSDEEGIRLQNRAADLGVTFFDTGAAYGNGRAERLLAETIRYAGRDKLVISTKYGYDFYGDPGEEGGHRERKQDFSRGFLHKDLDESLKRLGIDCIDLYQAHNLKLSQFNDELLGTMELFQRQGKIRYWGVALGPAIGWREEGYKSFIDCDAATVQTVFNLYEQDPGREFCEIAERRGRGAVIARVPTNSGILDEEFKSVDHTFPEHDHRKFRDRNWLVYGLQKNQIIRPMAERHGCSVKQFATRWLASHDTLCSLEPNILSEADLTEFVEACDGSPIDAETLSELSSLYAADFNLGEEAHPCDWKSSVTESGKVRSEYQPPALAV